MNNFLKSIFFFNSFNRNRWVAQRASLLKAGTFVLDVGAGSTPYRSFYNHCTYKAHDFSQLNPSQLSGKSGYGTIDYVSDILSITLPDSSVDAVLCTEVLEHVPEPIRAVSEFARILKPGGLLMLTAPLGSGIHQEPYHFYGGFTPYWYKKILKESGFKDIIVEPNGGFFKFYGQESIRFSMKLAPWSGKRQFLLFPFWLISLPWFVFICPLLGYVLDGLDCDKAFTIGYHVSAIRC